jgi:hypothetical protein
MSGCFRKYGDDRYVVWHALGWRIRDASAASPGILTAPGKVRGIGARKAARIRELVANPVSRRLSHGADVTREKRLRIRELNLLRKRVDALRRAGAIAWSGRQLRPAKSAGKVRGNKTVADLVVETRD